MSTSPQYEHLFKPKIFYLKENASYYFHEQLPRWIQILNCDKTDHRLWTDFKCPCHPPSELSFKSQPPSLLIICKFRQDDCLKVILDSSVCFSLLMCFVRLCKNSMCLMVRSRSASMLHCWTIYATLFGKISCNSFTIFGPCSRVLTKFKPFAIWFSLFHRFSRIVQSRL